LLPVSESICWLYDGISMVAQLNSSPKNARHLLGAITTVDLALTRNGQSRSDVLSVELLKLFCSVQEK
jgi:hypothetical protein